MTASRDRILFFGVGNPARGDDGLGPALAAAVEEMALPSVVVDANYQLTVEDAAQIAEYAAVVFADAALVDPAPFWFSRIDDASIVSARTLSWSSHSVSPAQVLSLARELFQSPVVGYTLGVRGYVFGDLEESLSIGASANLTEAVRFARRLLVDRFFDTPQSESERSAAGRCSAA